MYKRGLSTAPTNNGELYRAKLDGFSMSREGLIGLLVRHSPTNVRFRLDDARVTVYVEFTNLHALEDFVRSDSGPAGYAIHKCMLSHSRSRFGDAMLTTICAQ